MFLFGPNIKKMKGKRDIPGLLGALNHKDIKVRMSVIEALGDLKYIDGLTKALMDENKEVCLMAIEALEGIGGTEAIYGLLSRLEHSMFRDSLLWKRLLETSLRCCDKGIGINSTDDHLWYLKGYVLSKDGKINEALSSLKRAIDINPNNKKARECMARILKSSSFKKIAKDWKELKMAKQDASTRWKQVREKGDLLPLIHEMYETYRSEYEELNWNENESGLQICNIYRCIDNPNAYHCYELGLEATEFGVVLSCELNLSGILWLKMTDVGDHVWKERIAKFNFATLIDIETISEDDIAECFDYILERRQNKPKIAD